MLARMFFNGVAPHLTIASFFEWCGITAPYLNCTRCHERPRVHGFLVRGYCLCKACSDNEGGLNLVESRYNPGAMFTPRSELRGDQPMTQAANDVPLGSNADQEQAESEQGIGITTGENMAGPEIRPSHSLVLSQWNVGDPEVRCAHVDIEFGNRCTASLR